MVSHSNRSELSKVKRATVCVLKEIDTIGDDEKALFMVEFTLGMGYLFRTPNYNKSLEDRKRRHQALVDDIGAEIRKVIRRTPAMGEERKTVWFGDRTQITRSREC